MALIYEWLFSALFWLGALLFVLGLVLLLFPASLERLSRLLDKWIETRAVFDQLDEPIRLERQFYRHHRIMGLLILAGAGYCLYSLMGWVDYTELIVGIPELAGRGTSGMLLEGALLVLALGNLLALAVGMIVFFRPSLLKGIEAWGNRWIESDRFMEAMDRQVDVTGSWLPQNPRLIGLLAVIGSLYIMSNTAIVALR